MITTQDTTQETHLFTTLREISNSYIGSKTYVMPVMSIFYFLVPSKKLFLSIRNQGVEIKDKQLGIYLTHTNRSFSITRFSLLLDGEGSASCIHFPFAFNNYNGTDKTEEISKEGLFEIHCDGKPLTEKDKTVPCYMQTRLNANQVTPTCILFKRASGYYWRTPLPTSWAPRSCLVCKENRK